VYKPFTSDDVLGLWRRGCGKGVKNVPLWHAQDPVHQQHTKNLLEPKESAGGAD
jgi:hypothetical protein